MICAELSKLSWVACVVLNCIGTVKMIKSSSWDTVVVPTFINTSQNQCIVENLEKINESKILVRKLNLSIEPNLLHSVGRTLWQLAEWKKTKKYKWSDVFKHLDLIAESNNIGTLRNSSSIAISWRVSLIWCAVKGKKARPTNGKLKTAHQKYLKVGNLLSVDGSIAEVSLLQYYI